MPPVANFTFNTVPQLVCAAGSSSNLGQHVAARFPSVQRALIVTDPGFLRTGLLDLPTRSLVAHGISVMHYTDVMADPPESVLQDACDVARKHRADIIIGIGGGSSMDVAKLVAVLAGSEQPLASMYGIGNVTGARLPLVQLPTTAGTGSEATNIAIVTTGVSSKMGVVAPQLYADLVVLDAGLTLGLPQKVSAATGIDAMVHAIEAYTSRHKKNPISDMLVRQALALLAPNLIRVCENGNDLVAREAMLLGAYLAGQAFANAPVGAVHALAYPIGGIFHVPHGLSNSLVLPHVLRFNLEHAAPLYAELASVAVPHVGGSGEARAEALIVAMQQIAVITGIERTLLQVGIGAADLERLADAAMLQTRLLDNNPRVLSRADALQIYAAAL